MKPSRLPRSTPTDAVRRRFLAGLGALPLAGAIGGSLATPKSHAAATVKTQAKIVIAGGGAAGLAAASRLAAALDGATAGTTYSLGQPGASWTSPATTRTVAGSAPGAI